MQFIKKIQNKTWIQRVDLTVKRVARLFKNSFSIETTEHENYKKAFAKLGNVTPTNIHPYLSLSSSRAAEWVTSYQDMNIDVLRKAATKGFSMQTCKANFKCYPPKVLNEALSKLDWSAHKA